MAGRALAGVAMALAASVAAAAAPAPPDGFAPFWAAFAKAAGAGDTQALSGMVEMSSDLDPNLRPATFAAFYARDLGPKVRKCLAKAKPVRDVDGAGVVNYSAFCGQIIYVFYKTGSAWKLVGLGVND